MNYKVGLLLPKSVIYPSINFDIAGGMRVGLANMNINAEIKTESIGIGANDKDIYAQCEKLIMNGVSVVAAYINPMSAEKLAPLFAMGNALLIALDAGYHFPTTLNKHKNIFYLSLQGALCCRITATVAVADGMKNIAYTSSYYDAGYRSAYAFHKSLEAEGGEITYNHITQLKRQDFTLAPLQDHMKEGKTDAVFAAFCGDMLQDFFTAASGMDTFQEYPVYGSSFMGEELWLQQTTYPGRDVQCCVPWATGLELAENKKFISALEINKQKANIFSLLGWEAAMVAAKALQAGDTDKAAIELEGYTFESPRGLVTLDAETHQCHAPVYEAVMQKDETNGNCKLKIIREAANTEEQTKQLEQDIKNVSGPFTSWLNAYGCLDS